MAFEHETRLDETEPNIGTAQEIIRKHSVALAHALPGDRGRQLARACRAFARLIDAAVLTFEEASARILFDCFVNGLTRDDGRGAVADRIEAMLMQAPERGKPASIVPSTAVKPVKRGGRPKIAA